MFLHSKLHRQFCKDAGNCLSLLKHASSPKTCLLLDTAIQGGSLVKAWHTQAFAPNAGFRLEVGCFSGDRGVVACRT